jgi:hypothetical protein
VLSRLARLEQIVALRHLASPLLALVTAALVARRHAWSPLARLTLAPWALTLVAFLASTAWWAQYDAHLIASEALVAGGAFALLQGRWRSLALVASLLGVGFSLVHTVRRSLVPEEHSVLVLAQAPSLRETQECLFTFEPSWSLAAGRLPPRQTGPLIDSYAQKLLSAIGPQHQRFQSTDEAFAASPATPAGLLDCHYLLVGVRGARQLSLERLEATHRRTQLDGLEVWVHR